MRRQTPVKRLPKRDIPSFEDGITRRSPKLAQAVYNRLLQVAARKVSAEQRHNPRGFVAVRRFAAVGSPAARLLLFAS